MKNSTQRLGVKGFTLIELLVVIAIIGLLSSLAVVSLNSARGKARDSKRAADLRTLQSVIEIYAADSLEGEYPSSVSWTDLMSDISPYLSTFSSPPSPTDQYQYASITLNNKRVGYILAATGFETIGGGGVLIGDLDGVSGSIDHDQGATYDGTATAGTIEADSIECGSAGDNDAILCVGHLNY